MSVYTFGGFSRCVPADLDRVAVDDLALLGQDVDHVHGRAAGDRATRTSSVGRGPVFPAALSMTTSWPDPDRATNRDPPVCLRLTCF